MSGFYFKVYGLLPRSLRRRIDPLEESVQAFVAGAAERTPGSVVLDAGAGQARFAPLFAAHRYVALDFGRGDGSWDYSRLDVVADLARLPLKSDCASAVIHTQVLEHVPEPGHVLREIYRVLQPGGELFLTAPQGWHEHQQPYDYFRFTSFALVRLLDQAGFEDWSIDPMGGYFHYLGHRLTYIPKVLFWQRGRLARALLLPFELLSVALFCFGAPLVCYYLDRLDRDREFTLCYRCRACKKAG